MSTKIGDLFFDVYADVSSAVKSVDGLVGKFAGAGTAAARAIGQTIANATAIATVGVLALGTAAVTAGVEYNTLGQSATAAFTSIYDSATAAHDILQQISTLDLTTPFKSDALIGVSRTLAGFGVAKDDIIGMTAALAQATAAMGLGSDALHRMAIAFGQIQSRGKLAGDEARQLANYGIDAYGLLAEKMGLSVAEVRKLGQESKLVSSEVIPVLIDAINTRFSGAIERLSNTAAGQAEILGSQFRAIGAAIVEPFIGFSGGGAVVTAMKAISTEIGSLVSVADDGSFKLQGFLAPLTPVLERVAGAVERAAGGFARFVAAIPDDALLRVGDALQGLEPLVAALGAGLVTMVAQSIPFLGRFVAGFNPIVVAVTALILTSSKLRSTFADAFANILGIISPLIPKVQELLKGIVSLAEDAGPAIAEVLVNAFRALEPVVSSLLDAANALLPVLGPVLVEALRELADVLDAIAVVLSGDVTPKLALLAAALYGLSVLFPTLTLGIIANTAAVGLNGGAAALAATGWGMLATAIAGAYAAYLVWKPAIEGAGGTKQRQEFLASDVPTIEKPFQQAAQFVYTAWGGPTREQIQQMQDYERNLANLTATGKEFAQAQNPLGMSMQQFADLARDELPGVNSVNAALIEYRRLKDEAMQANLDAAAATDAYTAANAFEARVARDLGGATADLTAAEEDQVDVLKELKAAASAAWADVQKLAMAGSDATVDDFLAGLPALAKSVTEAMAETGPAILRNLDVGNALTKVKQTALGVIQTLAKDYGLSMDQIRALFDKRGLAGVIEVLGQITEDTTEKVDPLIAKYSSLGATADQLRAAIAKLNEQRQTAIQAQIDQVSKALDDAKQAAQDARDAVAAFLSGGYLGSAQQQVDKLIGDVGSIGSRIEDALRQGGVRGEAAVRTAFGDVQSQLAAIVNAGFKEGLSGQQISDLIAPVLQAINEEVGQGANRISSLDFTEGITGGAGAKLMEALQSGLDPGAIQSLINNILGADANVAGLQSRLEGLQADLKADVEFTPAQVQGALDQISAETELTVQRAVITPEAAQAVYDAIQGVLDDQELTAAVDKAVITQQILDAAQDAEDQISMLFRSGLSFDSAALDEVARAVSEEFYAAFTGNLAQLRDERAQQAGFADFNALRDAVGPTVATAIAGGQTIEQNVQIDAPISVTGAPTPILTATETVSAFSAAAGSGGSVSQLLDRYGLQVIPGLKGPQ